MQAETHGHLVVFNGRFKSLMLPIVANVLVFVHTGEHFQECQDRHVCYVSVLGRELDLLQILLSFELLRVRELPND